MRVMLDSYPPPGQCQASVLQVSVASKVPTNLARGVGAAEPDGEGVPVQLVGVLQDLAGGGEVVGSQGLGVGVVADVLCRG